MSRHDAQASTSPALETIPIAREEDSFGYAGWRIVLAAFFGVGISFARMVPFTFSLFVPPLQAAFGWNREAISDAFAIAALTVAAVSPALGSMLDRVPPRRVILPRILVFAVAMASLCGYLVDWNSWCDFEWAPARAVRLM